MDVKFEHDFTAPRPRVFIGRQRTVIASIDRSLGPHGRLPAAASRRSGSLFAGCPQTTMSSALPSLDQLRLSLFSRYTACTAYAFPKLRIIYSYIILQTLESYHIWRGRLFALSQRWHLSRLNPYFIDARGINIFVIISAATLVALVSLLLYCGRRRRLSAIGRPRDIHRPLNALLNLVSPSSSIWPAYFIQLSVGALIVGKETLVVSLSPLRDFCIRGRLELRPSTDALRDLLLDISEIEGWKIRLHVDASLRLRVIVGITLSYLSYLFPRVGPSISISYIETVDSW